jgi:YD repeat-containing protein
MTWDGYNLNSLTSNGVTYTYKYDQNGLRLSKTASNGTTTQYLRDANGRLIRETDGTNTIWYLYDQNGFIGFEYNGTSYYYITNLQGDVLKIVNANGAVVANYTYDSWGKVIASSGSMANINPIRYRGYYYDQEIQLYFT